MKNNEKIKVENLNFVTLKYYEQGRGVEVCDTLSYAFLINVDDNYINPFCPAEEYPVFERVPYSNVTLDGAEFGTKLKLVNDIDKSGPCYIVVGSKIFDKEEITFDELENFILRSSYFFKDRFYIAKERMSQMREPFKMLKIMKDDVHKLDDIDLYFYDRMKCQKVKSR